MDVGALQTYFGLSAFALFVYDYAITFQREVELDWTSEWNCVRVLFILIRYTPFASVPLHLFYLLSENISTKTCAAVFIASRWLLAVGIVSAEMVLLIRTWVLWNRRKSLLAVFVAGGTCIFAATIYGVWTRSLEDRDDTLQRRPRCQVLTGTPFVAVCIVAVMAFETVVLALTLVNLLQQLRQMGRSFFRFSLLLRVLYRDGIIFFIYLFIISLVNLIFVLTGPAIMNDLLIPLQHTLHSATTARVLLNLREASQVRGSGIVETSLIAFNEDLVCADPPV